MISGIEPPAVVPAGIPPWTALLAAGLFLALGALDRFGPAAFALSPF